MTTTVSSTAYSSTPAGLAKPQAVTSKEGKKPEMPSSSPTKVTISAAARSVAQADQEEATETANQSAQEASNGDKQAQRLLAQQAATHMLLKPAGA